MNWYEFIFKSSYSFFEVVGILVLTALAANYTLWWLLGFIPLVAISIWMQLKYIP